MLRQLCRFHRLNQPLLSATLQELLPACVHQGSWLAQHSTSASPGLASCGAGPSAPLLLRATWPLLDAGCRQNPQQQQHRLYSGEVQRHTPRTGSRRRGRGQPYVVRVPSKNPGTGDAVVADESSATSTEVGCFCLPVAAALGCGAHQVLLVLPLASSQRDLAVLFDKPQSGLKIWS